MKLAAIFICWADWDLLEHALKNIYPLVDGVIIVASETSNFGEKHPVPDWPDIYQREPNLRLDPRTSETDKRNFGLGIAREQGYTHYIAMDADEFYEPEPFLKAKQYIEEKDLNGLVCQCRTYFKSPQLTIGLDSTLVPFIHKITPTLRHEFNKNYPFAWIDGQIRIDPTRSLNINSGVETTDLVTLEHYSWIRSDYQKKIRNSTARRNLERSSILKDLSNAKPGYFCEFYQKTLMETDNLFNLPEWQ
jgi:hypothetical protein